MAGLKRTDSKGRILKDGETQRKDGSYRYRYVDADGEEMYIAAALYQQTEHLLGAKRILALEKKSVKSSVTWRMVLKPRLKTKRH